MHKKLNFLTITPFITVMIIIYNCSKKHFRTEKNLNKKIIFERFGADYRPVFQIEIFNYKYNICQN